MIKGQGFALQIPGMSLISPVILAATFGDLGGEVVKDEQAVQQTQLRVSGAGGRD